MITVLGRIFPAPFSLPDDLPGQGRRPSYACKEMTPDNRRGSFLCLGFNHWVTSLSADSAGLFDFGWNPFRSIHVLQLTFAIGIYVKRKIRKVRPAGVITIFGITFFGTISLPHLKGFYKTGYRTNNFCSFGRKQRNTSFSPDNN